MKRITSIQLENFRAFYGRHDSVLLPKGENLLVYGENGSGKSSFYKALQHFFESSRNAAFVFEENSFATAPVNGEIAINFADIDPATSLPVPGSDVLLAYNNAISTHRVQFVEDADVIKAFLDYRSLLKVYFGGSSNIFDLVVNQILYETIPTGEAVGIGVQLKAIDAVLQTTDRRYNDHHDALSDLHTFDGMLRTFLNEVFRKVNQLLMAYFRFNLRVFYNLAPIVFDHDYRIWDTIENMQLIIKLNGITLINHNEYLNEARLSALAICLYLAAIKRTPVNVDDYKILFLDDVFIGLDASNRIPILRMLVTEFSDYQIFITTYDRHWYELAQRYFSVNTPGKWLFDNLYVGSATIGTERIDNPIFVQKDDDSSKALFYLHHPVNPDYPASANYLRKFAEQILVNHLPPYEIRDEDYALIESYKLRALVNSCEAFFVKIGADITLIKQLANALPTLLHPLSHFNLSSPVYKSELVHIHKCLSDLEKYLIALKLTYRVFLTEGRMVKLQFTITAADTGVYEIYSKEVIYLLNDSAGIRLSLGACHIKRSYTLTGIGQTNENNYNKSNPLFNYVSISAAYTTIYNFIHGQVAYAHIPLAADYATEIWMPGVAGGAAWQTLRTLFVW